MPKTLSKDFITKTIEHLEELQEVIAYELDEHPQDTHYLPENLDELVQDLQAWYSLQDKVTN